MNRWMIPVSVLTLLIAFFPASPIAAQPCLGDIFGGGCLGSPCGDSVCDITSESCSTCPIDCGPCPPSCATPPGDMVVWWPFDASTAFAYPDRMGNNYALKVGSVTTSPGKVGNAVRFTDTNGFLEVLDSPEIDFLTGDFSIAFWARQNNAIGAIALEKRAPNAPWPIGWSAGVDWWPTLFLSDGSNSGANWSSGDTTDNNRWHHIVFSIDRDDPTGFEIFFNGQRSFAGDPLAAQGSLSNSADLIIGNLNSPGFATSWQGQLDEVQIFKQALSASEVRRIYDSGSTGLCPPDAPGTCAGGRSCSVDLDCGYDETFGTLGGCYQGSCVCK